MVCDALILDDKSRSDTYPYIEVEADTSTILLRITNLKTPVTLRVEEPIYFASLISLATTLDERPKSFT